MYFRARRSPLLRGVRETDPFLDMAYAEVLQTSGEPAEAVD
jgi:hypothetical protein